MANPFDVSAEIFSFVDVKPVKLDRLRLKSKRVISAAGEHSPAFGHESQKSWFTKETIGTVIDSNVDQRQQGRLSDQDIIEFNRLSDSA